MTELENKFFADKAKFFQDNNASDLAEILEKIKQVDSEKAYMELAITTVAKWPMQSHCSTGFVSEVGELLSAVKKQVGYGRPLSLPNLIEEIGDLLWFSKVWCIDYTIEPKIYDRDISKFENISQEHIDLTASALKELNKLAFYSKRLETMIKFLASRQVADVPFLVVASTELAGVVKDIYTQETLELEDKLVEYNPFILDKILLSFIRFLLTGDGSASGKLTHFGSLPMYPIFMEFIQSVYRANLYKLLIGRYKKAEYSEAHLVRDTRTEYELIEVVTKEWLIDYQWT